MESARNYKVSCKIKKSCPKCPRQASQWEASLDNAENRKPDNPEQDQADLASMTLLIERARGGCKDSRERVFTQLQSYLETVAHSCAGGQLMRKAGVSDIVQQAFVKVVQKFEDFRGNSSAEFRGWLKTLVLNEARQLRRAWARQQRDTTREEYIDAGHQDLGGWDPTPASQAIRKEQAVVLQSAISRLPADYQTVIRLRNFEHRSYDEIAAELGRSVEAVTKLWYRAVVKLQNDLIAEGE